MAQIPQNREEMTPNVKPSLANDSAGRAAGETADPNFTAARHDRDNALKDAGVTRMDTGQGLGALPPAAPKSRHATHVRDVMTFDVAVCEPTTRLNYVARMMQERDCGAIPVVQSTDSMKPIGIVTDRDIVIRGLAKNQDPLAMRASAVMSSDPLVVHPDMSLDECIGKMQTRQVRRAVVVDHTGRCCGIIAQADIVLGTGERGAGELVQDISLPDPASAGRHYH